jgi:hypothetical protein
MLFENALPDHLSNSSEESSQYNGIQPIPNGVPRAKCWLNAYDVD